MHYSFYSYKVKREFNSRERTIVTLVALFCGHGYFIIFLFVCFLLFLNKSSLTRDGACSCITFRCRTFYRAVTCPTYRFLSLLPRRVTPQQLLSCSQRASANPQVPRDMCLISKREPCLFSLRLKIWSILKNGSLLDNYSVN